MGTTSRWPTRPAAWFRGGWPSLADVIIVLVLEAVILLSYLSVDLTTVDLLLPQPTILIILWRRRFPIRVFAIIATLELLGMVVFHETSAYAALLVALYTVASHRDRRYAYMAAGVFEVTILLTAAFYTDPEASFLTTVGVLSSFMLASLFLGTTLRAQRQYLAGLRDRAERLERERDQHALLATTAERTRIAREMHDIVAHSLSVVIRLADGAVAASRTDPAIANEAMTQVATTGRQALAEMRTLLGVLRDDLPAQGRGDRSPQPDLQRIDLLLDEVRATGLAVTLSTSGTPLALPAIAETTIYRIIQEGLTNVLRHAIGPSRVDVELDWSADGLDVTIRDDGRVGRTTTDGAGQGLRGIRERVALYDGELVAGRVQPRGWQVQARLRFEGGAT